MPDTWLPRTPLEGLIKTDTVLADIVPRITTARQRLTELLPGHSGRPAGNGDPGGGSGATNTTVVERTAMQATVELRDLNRIDELTTRIETRTQQLAHPWATLTHPAGITHARRLAWVRWLLRKLIDQRTQPSTRRVEELWADVDELEHLIDVWAAPRPGGRRTLELAVDDTDTWCRSCLRAGYRNHRNTRYATDGLCRWCGDFQAEQGRLPTLDILDAHESGSSIAVAKLIRDKQHAPRKRRRKR